MAGTPATARFELTPAGLLSGIAMLITPEFVVNDPGTGGGTAAPTLNSVPLMPATPPQETAGVIATVGFGLTVNTAALEMLFVNIGLHEPLSTQR